MPAVSKGRVGALLLRVVSISHIEMIQVRTCHVQDRPYTGMSLRFVIISVVKVMFAAEVFCTAGRDWRSKES